MRSAIRTLAALALLASGCVWNDQCAPGAVRDEASGRCRVTQLDAGRDAASPDTGVDAGGAEDATTEDGGTDAATEDGGTDAGTPRTIEDFVVGTSHLCVIDSGGGLTCWGNNLIGQLATGDIAPQAAPRPVDLGAPVLAVAGKSLHACAQTAMPSLFCWGSNTAGQIGNGSASADPVPDPHALALGAARHVAGSIANTCFTDVFGEASCWGRNDHGQLAIGTVSAEVTVPGMEVQTSAGRLEDISQIALGDRHTLFLLTDGTLWCAGKNADGECGTTSGGSMPFATEVPGMTGVTSVAAGTGHSCAVQAGDVYCWGVNEAGQAAPGAGPDPVLSPTQVTGLGPVEQVVAGNGHSCALLTSGQVACWGSRMYGALGDGLPVDSSSVAAPVMVGSLSGVERIDSSLDVLVCALTGADELYCWGTDAIEFLGGLSGGARSVFLDEETVHTAPVRVDPFAG